MAINFVEIGERLRAYRMGANLSTDEVAEQLQISRAALYKYEKGSVIKLETIEKVADLLGVSVQSLLGVGVEYFSSPMAYYERKRQLEEKAEQVIYYFQPMSIVLTSPEYLHHLRLALIESIPSDIGDRAASIQEVDRIMTVMKGRHALRAARRAPVISLINATQVQHFLRTGFIGTYALPAQVRVERRQFARLEVERMAKLMESEPIGVQIGVIDDTMPNQTFEIIRTREKTFVAVSPFRLGEFPNIRAGVATITAAAEAVALYEKLTENLWSRALKGSRGAEFLHRLTAEGSRDEPRVVAAE